MRSFMEIPEHELQHDLNVTFSFEEDDYYNDIGKDIICKSQDYLDFIPQGILLDVANHMSLDTHTVMHFFIKLLICVN